MWTHRCELRARLRAPCSYLQVSWYFETIAQLTLARWNGKTCTSECKNDVVCYTRRLYGLRLDIRNSTISSPSCRHHRSLPFNKALHESLQCTWLDNNILILILSPLQEIPHHTFQKLFSLPPPWIHFSDYAPENHSRVKSGICRALSLDPRSSSPRFRDTQWS